MLYAYFKHLDYFSTECIYSPNAYRGFAREFLKVRIEMHDLIKVLDCVCLCVSVLSDGSRRIWRRCARRRS